MVIKVFGRFNTELHVSRPQRPDPPLTPVRNVLLHAAEKNKKYINN